MTNEEIRNRITDLAVREEQLSADLAVAKEEQSKLIAMAKAQAKAELHQLEQMELGLAHRNGDKTVVRDAGAGNGAGGYKRVSPGTAYQATARQVCESAQTAYGSATAAMTARLDNLNTLVNGKHDDAS